ncbi:MAG: hypothetical protein HKO10_03430 [Acidimicrobiia bacterium]|nr:hypothetical protein [Acidimicrobiia bacterium]
MIYRAAVIAAVIVVAGVAWISLPPVAPAEEEAPPEPLSGIQSGVFYCVGSGAGAETAFQAVSGSASTSLSSIIDSNMVVDTVEITTERPATAMFKPPGQLFTGGAVVEVEAVEAGASWINEGPTRTTATTCYAEPRNAWTIYGGPIGSADRLVLRLMNPLLSSAKADIRLTTEFGPEPITELESVGVPPRDVVEIPLHEILGQRTMVKVAVDVTDGRLLPAMVSTTPNGIATWRAERAATDWYLPTVRVGDVVGDIAVTNPRQEHVEVEYTGIDSSGVSGQETLVLEPLGHVVLPATSLGPVVLGSRISATGPVIVTLVGDSESGRYGESAISDLSRRWMVAGPSRGGAIDIWILNPSPTEANVTVGEGPSARTIQIRSGTSAHITVESPEGSLVASDQPVAVSWSTQGRLALSNASPLELE